LSPAGLPILEAHSLAWAECTLEREIDAGDHLVLLGRVREGVSNGQGRLPLTYFRRAFGSWAAH
jgi:flavin reductase (DIM6/NTAB) family NADH-FMN oxidoreductase RutF